MKKPDKDLQQLLVSSATEWMDRRRVLHTNIFRGAFQDAFEAGWHARDNVKRFHHEAEVESVKKEIERLETLLLDLAEEKDDAESKALALKYQLEGVQKAIK